MAVMYKLYQNNRKNFVNKGHWYARAINTQTVETSELADRIQRNCTVKRSDVVAVLTELVEVMQDELQASHAVKLNGFGTFKMGISSTGAPALSKWNTSKNIKGLHILFSPEGKKDANGKMRRTFLSGCVVKEAPKNDIADESLDNKAADGSQVNP